MNYINDPRSASNRLDHDQYVERWEEWLLEKWQNRKYATNDK